MLKKLVVSSLIIGLAGCSSINVPDIQTKEKKDTIPVYVRSNLSDYVPNSWNGTFCDSSKICTKVIVCAGNGHCKTIDGIIVDTGSVGLRITKEALGSLNKDLIPLRTKDKSGKIIPITTRINFPGYGNAEGYVTEAGVVLNNKKNVMTIQVITKAEDGIVNLPKSNGILGIGLDNGAMATDGHYYVGKQEILLPESSRIKNPLEQYGVISVKLPSSKDTKTVFSDINLKAKMPKYTRTQAGASIVSTFLTNNEDLCQSETAWAGYGTTTDNRIFLDYKDHYAVVVDKHHYKYSGPENIRYIPLSKWNAKHSHC